MGLLLTVEYEYVIGKLMAYVCQYQFSCLSSLAIHSGALVLKLTISIPQNQLGHLTFKHGGVKLPCIDALGAQKKFGSLEHCAGKTTQFSLQL